jgi:hypothetical protein
MWSAIINTIVGLWLIVSPSVFDMNKTTSNNNYIIGPLVITFSVISLWDINRNAIKANIVLGLWLLIALFALDFTRTVAFFTNAACGALIILLSSSERKNRKNFGGGWRSLFQHNPPHLREAERIELRLKETEHL